MKRKIEVFDLLGEKEIKAIDKLGYDFLAENGYDTVNADTDEVKRNKIKKELKKNRHGLLYCPLIDKDKMQILFYFELLKDGKKLMRSKAIKFKFREKSDNE